MSGNFKDESCCKQIEEFVGLRAKLYSYKMHEDGKEEKKCKGVKKLVVRKTMALEFQRVLFIVTATGLNVSQNLITEIKIMKEC